MTTKLVTDLQPGDLVDLENDPWADPNGTDPEFPFENCEVVVVERESRSCVRVDFNDRSFGFPPSHRVKLAA